jgi:hypothetical protein
MQGHMIGNAIMWPTNCGLINFNGAVVMHTLRRNGETGGPWAIAEKVWSGSGQKNLILGLTAGSQSGHKMVKIRKYLDHRIRTNWLWVENPWGRHPDKGAMAGQLPKL